MKQYLLYIFPILIFFSCETSPDETTNKVDSAAVEKPAKQKMFHGLPDLPANEKQITSAGIGKILLGDSLNSINYNYDSLQNIDVEYNGIHWPAKKILLNDRGWIIAESVNSVNQITSIRTNSPNFFTKENYHAGMNTDSLLLGSDSITVDIEKKVFMIYNQSIWFKIDPKSEKKFFKIKDPDLKNLKNSFIEEIFIICGDC